MLGQWDGNCSSYFFPLCFTKKNYCLKLSYIHNDTETHLSCNTAKIGDTLPSLHQMFALSVHKSIHADDNDLPYKIFMAFVY